jgi:hypothetical protein
MGVVVGIKGDSDDARGAACQDMNYRVGVEAFVLALESIGFQVRHRPCVDETSCALQTAS